MQNNKSGLRVGLRQSFALVLSLVLCLSLTGPIRAQSGGTIDAGTTIAVRTNEQIDVDRSDGRIFSGSVDQDVHDTRGQVALPRGTYVELIVRQITDNNEFAVDLESVSLNGRRLGV